METIIILLLFCISTASLCVFINDCMEPGMILRRYYLWLTYHWIKNWRKKDRWKRHLLKIIGMCIFCCGFYIGLTSILIFNSTVLHFSLTQLLLFYPIFAGLQHNIIKIILKLK